MFVDLDIYHQKIIAKIVLRDLDLLLEGQKCQMLVSLKRWELREKFVEIL